jgi:hypothetical protein
MPLQEGKVAWRTPWWCANVEAEPALRPRMSNPWYPLVFVESALKRNVSPSSKGSRAL